MGSKWMPVPHGFQLVGCEGMHVWIQIDAWGPKGAQMRPKFPHGPARRRANEKRISELDQLKLLNVAHS